MNNKKYCYIWTRVSTKRQEDNGGSLTDQKRACERYAKENGFIIKGYFGGTHESAKTPGKLISEMIKAAKKDKTVSHIIVKSIDRFSRNVEQGVIILSKLEKAGVVVVDADRRMDTSTRIGKMQLQMQLSFAEMDNGNRTDKFTSGRKHCMESGVYCGPAPIGYTKKGKSMGTTYVINEDGKLLARAFKWKLQGLSNQQIIDRLATYGLIISKQKMHKILTNIFYTGKFKNKMMNYEVKDGNHPAIVSHKDFLRVQEILSGRTGVYKHRDKNDSFPLNRHVYCVKDNQPLTHYTNRKKKLDYYKCNCKGCCTNISAKRLHSMYMELLELYSVPSELSDIMRQMIDRIIKNGSGESEKDVVLLRKQKTETENKLKKAKLRWATGENDDEEAYREALKMLQEQLDKIELKLSEVESELSNQPSDVDAVISMCCNLDTLWQRSSLEMKQRLQNLLFPKGILYDKENGIYRTIKANEAVEVMRKISAVYRNKKEENPVGNSSLVNSCA